MKIRVFARAAAVYNRWPVIDTEKQGRRDLGGAAEGWSEGCIAQREKHNLSVGSFSRTAAGNRA